MDRISVAGACTVFGAALVIFGTAHALTPADKCESSELKTSGKYGFCRLKAEAKAVKTGGSPDYSKCDAKFADKFSAADTKGMGQCPSSATQAEIQSAITQCTGDVAAALGGTPHSTCQPPPLKTGQTTAFGTGSDGALQKGASQAFTDNGDGTITDNTTGLMWEKKSDDGDLIHDMDNTYTWSGASFGTTNIMDGTITTTFLAGLNGGSGFAGHTDWRIPNVNELESIRSFENLPATYSAFNSGCAASCSVTTCSCTNPSAYWSSTTFIDFPETAWTVYFSEGRILNNDKSSSSFLYARAVRGGS